MARKIDPKELVDAEGVAEIIGVGSRNAVSVYRSRHPDFPRPLVDLGKGRCLLWLRQDVERWAKARRAAGARETPNPGRIRGR